MDVFSVFIAIFMIGSVHGTTDVDTAWMKTTIQSHFSQSRNHVSGSKYKEQAKNFILEQFTGYGLETHTHTFSTGISMVKGKNVIGVSKGKYFRTDQDRVVGVAAHYDTARDTPGVDSNGAGVVGMLQAAQHLAKIPRDFTVVFVAFDFLLNEDRACTSLGCGSESFMNEWVNSYWSTPPTTAGVIVMDTIMNFNDSQESQSLPAGFDSLFPNVVSSIASNNNKGDFLAVIGRPFDRDVLNKFIQSYNALGQSEFGVEKIDISSLTESTVTVSDISRYSDLMRSDHRTFWSRGIPSIFITDTANFRGYMKTCFHSSCDDMSRVTDKMIQFAGKTTQAVIDTVNKLAPRSRAGIHRADVSLLGFLGTLLWINAVFTV
ncbi:uncharacterized protein YfbL-like isoform X4 [Haliotis asinina]|uniref:uncharacterized protein YfbL-like isoform X1 n=1 Tax=Haliotis asinina TaxID=109174 RepID=UPI003531E323